MHTTRPLHHIGIAVRDLEASLAVWRDALGLTCESVSVMPERGLEIAFLRAGATLIELLSPLTPQSEISGFLEKRGEGIHHVCLAVPDIRQALADAEASGVRCVSREPSVGAEGLPVAFLHPKSLNGVLVELIEAA